MLETTIALEKRSMALYARFAKIFAYDSVLHEFWFGMARDEARHVGALDLVLAVLDLEGQAEQPSPVPCDEESIARLRSLLDHYMAEPDREFPIERALAIALEVEETELEDMVGSLLRGLPKRDEYERCQRLLVHDLSELSYMIERFCQDAALLQRCDQLVEHHAETLRDSAAS